MYWALAMMLVAMTGVTQAAKFNLRVVDNDGNPVNGFRWVVQEDTTWAVDPTNPPPLDQQLATNFHKSYHPIAQTVGPVGVGGKPLKGHVDTSSTVVTHVKPGRYFVSVLPYKGYAMGGAPVTVLPNAQDPNNTLDEAVVVVQAHPIPTAQIAVYLFHDCYPLNGAPDLPEEQNGSGACVPNYVDFSQFRVVIEEPAGKYGANGGPLNQDAFGNPLGTVYLNQDPNTPKTGPNGCPARADGSCADGTLIPNPDGTLVIKNLAPGKYGVLVTPPTGQGWVQTSTIESTPVIDAWVKPNEPPFMVEFGLPGPHVSFGFTQQRNTLSDGVSAATVAGRITDMHMSRPPATQLYSGRPFPQCWIAVNEAGLKPGINRYAAPCNPDSTFSIPNVPPGNYELKVFDKPLDIVIATMNFTVDPNGTCNGGQSCDFGNVPVFNWNNRLITYIFNDIDQDGFWDANEGPLGAESGPVNIRWRDGTIYQTFPTDVEGVAPFEEAFPWFNWMVAEVGFGNKKATGATIVVDAGGPVDTTTDVFPGFGELNPQHQGTINPNTGDDLSRTEVGQVLTEAFQGFLGQTNVIQFGKSDYLNLDFSPVKLGFPPKYVGENGGITGIVFNTVTRAENDPQFAVGESWEPGVPRVQVTLYADGDIDSPVIFPALPFPYGTGDIDWNGNGIFDPDDNQIDDINGDGVITLADVDNYPLGWGDPNCDATVPGNTCARGPEDVDRNGNGVFDLGDAISVSWTDSWDDNTPTGCKGQNNLPGIADDRCFDGMRNWNQVRPGVFDGGYALNQYNLSHLQTANPGAAAQIQAFYDYVTGSGFLNPPLDPAVVATLQLGLLPGDYIVETETPPGYEPLREEHKNVDLGDTFKPAAAALPPACVGEPHTVPPYFALVTKDGSGTDPGDGSNLVDPALLNDPAAAAPFAGQVRPLCNRKKVHLSAAQNAAADFFLVSDVPVAANVTGIILNDLGNEFNPNTPNFGEKFAPPLVPVAFYDWNGKEVNRVYSDEFGAYNAMLPSTWNANLPQPSGMSPNMVVACMNDAGPIPNPLIGTTDPATGKVITANDVPAKVVDPFFNPAFSQFCYTFQYMPGSTTYLDTPVIPVAAYSSPVTYPVDCALPERTPMIKSVENSTLATGPFAFAGNQLVIRSVGIEQVPNPEWDGVDPATRFITRNRKFGGKNNPGSVKLVDKNGVATPLIIDSWRPNTIKATIPATLAAGEYQLVVTRVGGVPAPVDSEVGVTVTVAPAGTPLPRVVRPTDPRGPNGEGPIQMAIDQASPGDLILVAPGQYDELVIMHKPVKLQGYGAGAVTINARQVPTEKVQAWRTKIDLLTDGNPANGEIDLLPGQAPEAGPFQALGAPKFPTEEGAGIFVAGRAKGPTRFGKRSNRGARVDGFTIVGASQGGGIVVNGYAQFLNIGNNILTSNAGFYGGGIRVGHPGLTNQNGGQLAYTDAKNDRVRIHHNMVYKNGLIGTGTGAGGGGIALYTGADRYRVEENWVCGNYSTGNGGGIAHIGVSNGGRIEHNDILFNESFSQANTVAGGGIYIGGKSPLAPNAAGLQLSDGTGNVIVNANRIHGNMAGAGDGGGIAVNAANGADVVRSQIGNSTRYRHGKWWDVGIFNNIITNNVTAVAGALSIQDSLEVHVRNNTIANNDSTATAAQAFTPGFPNQSNAQPAGIVSRFHTPDMAALLAPISNVPRNGRGRETEYKTFSDADLVNNIVFQNQSFYWLNYDDPATPIIETGLFPANCTTAPACTLDPIAASNDIAVLDGQVDTGEVMFARFNLLTNVADNTAEYSGGHQVFTLDPAFVNPVINEGKNGVNIPEFTVLQTAGAFDEGGNFIQVAFGPLSLVQFGSVPKDRVFYDYHITATSPAVSAGQNVGVRGVLATDFDGDPRLNGNTNEIGADELP